MQEFLLGKTAIITGGSKGIGREIARLFGHAGCQVVITGRDKKALFNTADKLIAEGINAMPVSADVINSDDCQRTIHEVKEKFGRLDILVNNAGMSMRGLFEQTEIEVFRNIMEINFIGAVNMTKLSLPHIKENAGSILFVSSIAGLRGLPALAPYSASKMALKSFFESLRAENVGQVHFGIIFAGVTENDTDKKILTGSGEIISILPRKAHSGQRDVAQAALHMVKYRKRQIVMTPLGRLARLSYTLFPVISELMITRFANKSSLYGSSGIIKKKIINNRWQKKN